MGPTNEQCKDYANIKEPPAGVDAMCWEGVVEQPILSNSCCDAENPISYTEKW